MILFYQDNAKHEIQNSTSPDKSSEDTRRSSSGKGINDDDVSWCEMMENI